MVKFTIEKYFKLGGDNIWKHFDKFSKNPVLLVSLFKHGIGLNYEDELRRFPLY